VTARHKHYVPVTADDSIAGAFAKRVAMSPDAPAYREYDEGARAWKAHTWSETARMVGRVRAGYAAEGLAPGDRVAIMLRNGKEWSGSTRAPWRKFRRRAALRRRPADNTAYCLGDSGVKLLVVQGEEHLQRLAEVRAQLAR